MASPGVSGGAHGDAGTAGRPSDLLLRFFESDFFDEWIAVQYLYQNNSPGVHAYLCNKLFQFPDHKLDRYLLQLIYVALQRPGGCLEKTIVQLCAKSFKLAVKVCSVACPVCAQGVRGKCRH